jgi:hypothetical protein
MCGFVLHLHLHVDHFADFIVAVDVEFLVQVLRFLVLLLEPGESRFDVGGRDRLAAGLRFLAKQDALDNVLPRPFRELGLPLGGLHLTPVRSWAAAAAFLLNARS